MELWNKARSFAEETAKRTQEITKEAAKRSQDLPLGATKFSEVVAEATKRSKEIAAEASKRADQLRLEAIKRAEGIKTFADGINAPGRIALLEPYVGSDIDEKGLERFGITDELREFVQGITLTTFQDFPLADDIQEPDVPAVSNVSPDLSEWQEKHATLVLSKVKEISKLRYELCPRVMKERKFWKIYFILVHNHIAPYQKQYMEDAKVKSSDQEKDQQAMKPPNVGLASNQVIEVKKNGPTTSTEQDLDVFLLGDIGDSDDEADDGSGDIDFGLDKMNNLDDKKEKS
ncbi:uncharacterized protein LOC114713340 isoform X2 [Neltuma alba]|uniref:uncharacterized protein LOC114713340 isoform X2 n=1 Tax=Neltuma alba TaxID=207710 RepID=UPI0010A3B43C|nr:uncharacterized protein LOC114713340 isoform X2 [Prosopis alba]